MSAISCHQNPTNLGCSGASYGPRHCSHPEVAPKRPRSGQLRSGQLFLFVLILFFPIFFGDISSTRTGISIKLPISFAPLRHGDCPSVTRKDKGEKKNYFLLSFPRVSCFPWSFFFFQGPRELGQSSHDLPQFVSR